MEYDDVIARIESSRNQKNIDGMARFGINPANTYGISIPVLRGMSKQIKKDHELASRLWGSGIHEARILASLIDDPALVTGKQMESWVKDFDSWDVCDQCCSNLFDKTPYAYKKAIEWTRRKEEFVKRAGFVLMATLSVHDKKAKDAQFETFFLAIQREATDERNFVKKAVNWALRQIGKRNTALNGRAIKVAKDIQKLDSNAARWIATDALRELQSEAVQNRIKKKRLTPQAPSRTPRT